MITHYEKKSYKDAKEYFCDNIKTVPYGTTWRGHGVEYVCSSKESILSFIFKYQDVIENTFRYKEIEDKNK